MSSPKFDKPEFDSADAVEVFKEARSRKSSSAELKALRRASSAIALDESSDDSPKVRRRSRSSKADLDSPVSLARKSSSSSESPSPSPPTRKISAKLSATPESAASSLKDMVDDAEDVKNAAHAASPRKESVSALSPRGSSVRYGVLEKMKDGCCLGITDWLGKKKLYPFFLSDDCSALVWFIRGCSVTKTPTLLFVRDIVSVSLSTRSSRGAKDHFSILISTCHRGTMTLSATNALDYSIWSTGLPYLVDFYQVQGKTRAPESFIVSPYPPSMIKAHSDDNSVRVRSKVDRELEALKEVWEDYREQALNISLDQCKFFEYVMLNVERVKRGFALLEQEKLTMSDAMYDFYAWKTALDLECLGHILQASS